MAKSITADRRNVSSQSHEIQYVIDSLAKEFPNKSREEIRSAVEFAKERAQLSESREKVLSAARERLR